MPKNWMTEPLTPASKKRAVGRPRKIKETIETPVPVPVAENKDVHPIKEKLNIIEEACNSADMQKSTKSLPRLSYIGESKISPVRG